MIKSYKSSPTSSSLHATSAGGTSPVPSTTTFTLSSPKRLGCLPSPGKKMHLSDPSDDPTAFSLSPSCGSYSGSSSSGSSFKGISVATNMSFGGGHTGALLLQSNQFPSTVSCSSASSQGSNRTLMDSPPHGYGGGNSGNSNSNGTVGNGNCPRRDSSGSFYDEDDVAGGDSSYVDDLFDRYDDDEREETLKLLMGLGNKSPREATATATNTRDGDFKEGGQQQQQQQQVLSSFSSSPSSRVASLSCSSSSHARESSLTPPPPTKTAGNRSALPPPRVINPLPLPARLRKDSDGVEAMPMVGGEHTGGQAAGSTTTTNNNNNNKRGRGFSSNSLLMSLAGDDDVMDRGVSVGSSGVLFGPNDDEDDGDWTGEFDDKSPFGNPPEDDLLTVEPLMGYGAQLDAALEGMWRDGGRRDDYSASSTDSENEQDTAHAHAHAGGDLKPGTGYDSADDDDDDENTDDCVQVNRRADKSSSAMWCEWPSNLAEDTAVKDALERERLAEVARRNTTGLTPMLKGLRPEDDGTLERDERGTSFVL